MDHSLGMQDQRITLASNRQRTAPRGDANMNAAPTRSGRRTNRAPQADSRAGPEAAVAPQQSGAGRQVERGKRHQEADDVKKLTPAMANRYAATRSPPRTNAFSGFGGIGQAGDGVADITRAEANRVRGETHFPAGRCRVIDGVARRVVTSGASGGNGTA